jgi:hypothetical protein
MAALAASTNAITAATAAPSSDRASNSANPTLTLRERAMGRASTIAASFSGAPTGSAGSGSAGGVAGSGGSASSGGVAASGGSFGGAGPAPAALQRQQLRLLVEAYSKTQRLALNLERVVRGVAQVRLILGFVAGNVSCMISHVDDCAAQLAWLRHSCDALQLRLAAPECSQQLLLSRTVVHLYLMASNCSACVAVCVQVDVLSMAEGLWPAFMGSYPAQELSWLKAAYKDEVNCEYVGIARVLCNRSALGTCYWHACLPSLPL